MLKDLKNYEQLIKETNGMVEVEDTWCYNCGGLALGTYNWIKLNSFRMAEWELEDCECDDNEYEELLQMEIEEVVEDCVNELLARFRNLREISSIAELRENEYAFAFRVASDDFHFIRRLDNGSWVHKPGHSQIREVTDEFVFAKTWPHYDTPYRSTIYLFANTKE